MEELVDFARRNPRLFVLTGAGISTASGIPDYRDTSGNWKRRPPVQYGEFIRNERLRKRYWARSLVGWRRFSGARPGRAHDALADLERLRLLQHLVTQNVDGLHQRAGSRRVLDLHGRLDRVACLECGAGVARDDYQVRLETDNPDFRELTADVAPDGDAQVEGVDFEAFRIPACEACGGMIKPAVVFFGESVPRERVDDAFRMLEESDAVLVAGSSLMVWSGYRFCRRAVEAGKPVAAINLGRTRADDVLTLKIERDCGEALEALLQGLAA